MTWAFAYITTLLVGLVLAGVTGVLTDLRSLGRQRLVVPHQDQGPAFFAVVGRRISVGLILAGVIGLLLGTRRSAEPLPSLAIACGVGLVGFLVACVVFRRGPGARAVVERAVVVRDIAPGGYGQVRIERGKAGLILAAQSVDDSVIPAGTVVEVVDDTRSVLVVRRQTAA